jgi:outer membrane protein assembly factor BamB
LYAGKTADKLFPCGVPVAFYEDHKSGYFSGKVVETWFLSLGYFQVWVWKGAETFELAPQIGKSNVLQLWPGNPGAGVPTMPSELIGLESFSLTAVHVPEAPPVFKKISMPGVMVTGHPAEFMTIVLGALPLTYQWKKDGQAIEGANDRVFTIESVELSDAGSYTIEVTNSVGTIESETFEVTARPPESGDLKWDFLMNGPVVSAPAIGVDGTVYVTSYHRRIVALDGQTGAEKWVFEPGGSVSSSPAIGVDGTVYFGCEDKKVYALDGQTGAKKWEYATGGSVASSPAIGIDGTIYVGSDDGKIHALYGQPGAKRWTFPTGHTGGVSPSIGADGTIYIGSGPKNKVTHAFDGQTGARKWVFPAGGIGNSSPAIGVDGTVYVGSHGGRLYALDGQTGSKKWAFATKGSIESSPAIAADGTVYVGSDDGKFYALSSRTGAKKWEFETGGSVRSSPAIAPDGTIYVGSNDGRVYAFYGSAGPADSAWPMFGQNAQRTSRVPLPLIEPTELNITGATVFPFTFTFATAKGVTYEVQTSSNLVTWRALTTIQSTSGKAKFIDTRKARFPRQYYRVKQAE